MLRILALSRQIIAKFLVFALLIMHLWSIAPMPVLANNPTDLTRLKQEFLEQAKKFSNAAFDEALKLKNLTVEESARLSQIAVEKAQKLPSSTLVAINRLSQLLVDKQLIAHALEFSNMTSGTFCKAYFDSAQGVNDAAWAAIEKGAETTFAIAQAILSASAAEAGSLSGYAGIASVVSDLGLGSITTSIAGLLGSDAVGAAATSVVTASVGGPVVMGALLAGGAVATAYGTYELGKFSADKFNNWANQYCTLNASLP